MRYETARSRRQGQADRPTDLLARGLGLFSIALGAVEMMAPGKLARGLGMEGQEHLIQAYGAREIGTGVGILSSQDPTGWIWGRVAGDALDIATLAAGLRADNPQRGNVGLALAAVVGVTVLDVLCAERLSSESRRPLRAARDYSGRSGFPRPIELMRGAAKDAPIGADMREPAAMRPNPAARATSVVPGMA